MLMLTRRQNQQIRIGDNIIISVSKLCDDRVVLGFDVPKQIPVNREEIYQQILLENKSQTILGQRKRRKGSTNTAKEFEA